MVEVGANYSRSASSIDILEGADGIEGGSIERKGASHVPSGDSARILSLLARFAITRSRECPVKDLCLCLRTMIVFMSAVGSRHGAFAPADTKRPTRR
jgi:hypothetical protein